MKPDLLSAEYLNEHCHCSTLEKKKMAYPQYFSDQPHFVSRTQLFQMQQFIAAYERALRTPEVLRQLTGNSAAPIEQGIFTSYDFHMHADGPQLIEINTNAAGAVLALDATRQMINCCDSVDDMLPVRPYRFDAAQFIAMFRSEFARRFPGRTLETVAIVDEAPEQQFFYPEFLLTQKLLQEHGISALIVSPEAISISGDEVYAEQTDGTKTRIDFIYNRLTDFTLENLKHAALREVYDRGLATMSPNPALHALYARKSNLAAFWSPAFDQVGDIALIRRHIPETRVVDESNRDEMWQSRKEWFFKPVSGFGGKAVYRGDKLTTRVWSEISAGGYIAQKYVPPRLRQLSADLSLKYDLRVYTYGEDILGMMARYYQGQTTNFRTEHGGLASVMVAA